MRTMWLFISYLVRAQPPPSPDIMEFLSTDEKLVSLGSIYLLPQNRSGVPPREEIPLL